MEIMIVNENGDVIKVISIEDDIGDLDKSMPRALLMEEIVRVYQKLKK